VKVTTNVTTKVEKEIDICFFAENDARFGLIVVWAFVPGTLIQVRYVVDVKTLEISSFSWKNETSKKLHIELREKGLISKKKVPLPILARLLRPFDRTYTVRAFTRKVW